MTYPNFQVVVVDNGSDDGSQEAIRERFTSVTLLENGENLGFAGGNNVGISFALQRGADYVLLLNNDTVVDPRCLTLLVDAADGNERIGIVGPTIYYFDEPGLVWSAGGRMDWRRGRPYLSPPSRDEDEVDYVTGCAMLVKSEVIRRIGLLDERFFMYFEEVDWCIRAKRVGFEVVHVPEAKVWHKISLEKQFASPRISYYMTRNRLLFLKKAGAGPIAWLYTLFLDYLRTILSWSIRPKYRGKRAQRDAMIRAISDFWRGRFGRR
jgi:hypothetical protein